MTCSCYFLHCWGLNSLLTKQKWWYAFALTGLLLTNLRGIYCFVALTLIHFILHKRQLVFYKKTFSSAYIVPLLIFALFLIYQYMTLGWIIITPNKNYAGHRESVGIFSILKNIAVYIKNFLDVGRVLLWIVFGFILVKWRKRLLKNIDKKNQILVIAFFSFSTVFFLGMVPFSNPIGSRYFMICYILAILLFINSIYTPKLISRYKRRLFITFVSIGFLTGHLWIYPTKIAQSWDSSLAYLNYFPVEDKMLVFLKDQGIAESDVGTELPMHSYWYSRAQKEQSFYTNFKNVNTIQNKYILLSNIENQSSDEIIDSLESDWELIKSFEQMGVFMRLYENPTY